MHAIESAATPGVAGEDQQILTFYSTGELYGTSIEQVKEIIQFGQVTDVPLMPAWIRGVINLRGAVLPVVDLAVRFGRPPAALGRRSCIVVLELQRDEGRVDIGMLVDAVSEVIEIAAQDIEPPPPFGAHIRTDFIRGMGKLEQRFVVLIDVQRTLSMEELGAVTGGQSAAPLAALPAPTGAVH